MQYVGHVAIHDWKAGKSIEVNDEGVIEVRTSLSSFGDLGKVVPATVKWVPVTQGMKVCHWTTCVGDLFEIFGEIFEQ